MAEGLALGQLGVSIFKGVAGVKNAKAQAQAEIDHANYQSKVLAINSEIAGRQAKDAIDRGDKAASDYGVKVQKFVGSQTAAQAANGIDVSSGTAAKQQSETQILGAMDKITIKNNAWKEAYGFRAEALNNSLQGQLLKSGAAQSAHNTIVASGINAASDVAGGIYNYFK